MKTTKEHFKIPYTQQQVTDMLRAAVMAEVSYRNRTFIEPPELTNSIQAIAHWLRIRPTIGLLICGMPGNGKSTMLKAVTTLVNSLRPTDPIGNNLQIRSVGARDIVEAAAKDGLLYKQYSSTAMLAIDDIGTEPTEIIDYGNILTPLVDLLYKRYDEQLFTIITTNLAPKDVREKYNERIADRFNEMMTKIVFRNPSFRTNQTIE